MSIEPGQQFKLGDTIYTVEVVSPHNVYLYARPPGRQPAYRRVEVGGPAYKRMLKCVSER